ncbi:MAG: H/ACA ribonucleoprotein complex subunit GAR1 [Candidatus Thorarchaeota archaeon]
MKKIGKVDIIVKHNLLVRSPTIYRLGSSVVNQEIKKVGRIVDIIGPANSPYIVINTKGSEIQTTLGDVVYLFEQQSKQTPSRSKKGRTPPKKYHNTSNRK